MIKLRLLCVLTLFIWHGQICAERRDPFTEQSIRDQIYDVSKQFVNDIVTIEEHFQDNLLIQYILERSVLVISQIIPTELNLKMDVNQVKAYSSSNQNLSSAMKSLAFDYFTVSQLILSKQLPPERYNGVINLFFACIFDFATTEEIQSALNYLYGIDAEATKTSFLDSHNLPKLSDDDCPTNLRMSETIDALSRLVDVKPRVKQDFLAVHEQFPCNGFAVAPLEYLIDVLQRSGGNVQKVSACMIIEKSRQFGSKRETRRQMLETGQALLSTRLPDETVRRLINFQRITIPGTPIDEIEKALEYLYDDMPKSECPTAESSTLKAD